MLPSDLCFFPVFKPEELRQALMPTLESLYRQDPESLPFRMPVDPQLLCIPVRIPVQTSVMGSIYTSYPLKMKPQPLWVEIELKIRGGTVRLAVDQ